MDLIYADKNGIEQGVINDYELDVAFGRDENNFALELIMEDHCCEAGYFVYLENTEYGGIIDKIEPNTEEGTVTYEGRTWHGIINGKIIEPADGQDYKIVNGEANSVLAELIEELGMSSIFSVSSEESAVIIEHYQFDRYCKAYTGILKMLLSNMGKLQMTKSYGKVILNAVPLFDYSRDEEWDSGQLDFSITKDYHPVNHLICLGNGDLRERKVIHLFADENGGIMPFAKVAVPLSDVDYIIDKSKQVLFGTDEVSEVYDYSNAQTTLNYVILDSQPSDWRKWYTNYYYKEDDSFKKLEKTYEDSYNVFSSEPSDWSDNYGKYFYRSGSDYKSVEGVERVSYSIQSVKPSDWSKNYKNYFVYWSDGVTSEYKSVEGETKYRYNPQTMKPTDWDKNFKNYYYATPNIVFEYVVEERGDNGIWTTYTETLSNQEQAVDTPKKKYCSNRRIVTSWQYENISGDYSPVWKPNRYYTRESYKVAPDWEENHYYTENVSVVSPEFKSGKYYDKSSAECIPVFKKKTYYKLYTDNYADLVVNGLNRLKELSNCDKITANLDAYQEYDINDIVGATELKTGISVFKPITKKIVTFKENIESIEYEIGE